MYIEQKHKTFLLCEILYGKSSWFLDILDKIRNVGNIISINDVVETSLAKKEYGIDSHDYIYEKEIINKCIIIYEIEKDVFDKLPKKYNKDFEKDVMEWEKIVLL